MQMWFNPFSSVRVWLEVRLYSRRGKLIFEHRQPVRSFLANWTKAIYGLSYSYPDASVVKLVDISGSDRYYPDLYNDSYPLFQMTAPEGVSGRGIVFGRGTTSPSINDYKLEDPIPHGTGSGQLYYNPTHTSYEIESDRGRFIVYRTANNQSGGDITVSEIGLVFRYRNNQGYNIDVLILRDVLDTAVVVANAQSVEGRYVMEFLL